MLISRSIQCPYCGERFAVEIDTSAGDHDTIEDCHVCCRPINFHIEVDYAGKLLGVKTLRDDD